ncbi:MAG: HEAT repeat domain-containing protein [Planctomycetota bacterium]
MPAVWIAVVVLSSFTSSGDGLIAIAEREAEREKAEKSKEVKGLILELSLSDNPQLAYVSERLDKLINLGPAVMPALLEAIKGAGNDIDGTRRATNVAFAIGMILKDHPDPATVETLKQTVSDGSLTTRAAAIRALGILAEPSALPLLEAALAGSQIDLAVAAAAALGCYSSQESGAILHKALQSPDAGLHRVVVHSLAQMQYGPALAELLDELPKSDLGDTRKEILAFAAKQGSIDALDKLDRFLGTPAPTDLRYAAIEAVRDIAKRGRTSDKSKAIAILARIVESPTDGLSERAAIALHLLGDDRGLDLVIEDESRMLRGNPKNFAARVSRARKYYAFQRYGDAIKDCRAAIDAVRGQTSTGPVNVLLAACYAGMEDFKTARRFLEKSELDSLKPLTETYPELAEMAKDPKYGKLFEK